MDDIVLTHATLDVGKISRSVPIPHYTLRIISK